MTLLLPSARIGERGAASRGPLAPLARSLASDLAPLLADGFELPREKAMLSRAGGRCADDGTLLDFDPFNSRVHRCTRCGRTYEAEEHYRWWVMSYQLWLAERAVHASVLRLTNGDEPAGALAETILGAYADAYLTYPNSDNVLGPTRLFFSTYLESIWLLQVCVALDLLEASGLKGQLGARVRERIIEPSATLIRSYDEGSSNRQVWNNAALLASSVQLGTIPALEPIIWGPSGLVSHLAKGLLADGTWYEGENYHLFAHRGLWYGVQMAEHLELGLGETFVTPYIARFDAGFAASFASALPDLTLPSRRDSQYAISLRQWRFAELCELGLVRLDEPRLQGLLAQLYAHDVPRRETGRARSTAEVERNLPPTRLTRADLGWRSLLLARAELPASQPEPPRSVLLDGQGLAVFRRNEGAVYVALDYGHSGGGHGHPDRLNLLLAHDGVRWLDDMGTGSYVDPTLHWYRSTLAHNAPLVNGRSQERVSGTLLAFEEDDIVGWIDATAADIAPGVVARRAVVVTPGYLIDVLQCQASDGSMLDVPLHLDVDTHDVVSWLPAPFPGGDGVEDGFRYVSGSACVTGRADDVFRLAGRRGDHGVAAWISIDRDHERWRAMGPGAPGNPPARFYVFRTRGSGSMVRSVLDWSGTVRAVRFGASTIEVDCADDSVHIHAREENGWAVAIAKDGVTTRRVLRGTRALPPAGGSLGQAGTTTPAGRRQHTIPVASDASGVGASKPLTFTLDEAHYRRSELPWAEAGRPRATVSLFVAGTRLHVDVTVRKDGPLVFAPPRVSNPLDNEHPDINSDGVQLHLGEAGPASDVLTWLLVPIPGSTAVRIGRPPRGPMVDAVWSPVREGYVVRCTLALTTDMQRDGFDLDVIVNEIPPDRARRRGQLVMSGGGDWIFLRGDRQARDRLLHFALARA